MSWLGGLNESFTQLSSLTGQLGGQITNFTKEVLTEGADDNVDYEVETEKLKQQLKQYVLHLQEKEALVERLQQQNALLQDKANKAELDISTSGIEYEARLQQKSKEIALLKDKLSDRKGVESGDTAVGVLGHPILSSSFSAVTSDIGDDHFHEVIGYQQEIERLSHELEEARAQREAWKEKANSIPSAEDVSGTRQNADEAVFDRVKELESALHRESKHHHQELKTIQDAHEATLRRYQDEIRKLKSSASANGDSAEKNLLTGQSEPRDVNRIHGELETLREQLRTKNRQLQAQKKNLEDVQAASNSSHAELQSLIAERASLKEEIQRLLQENQKVGNDSESKQKTLQDIYNGVQELVLATGVDKTVNDGNVLDVIADVKRISVRNSAVRSDVNHSEGSGGDLAESDQWHNVELLDAAEEDQNAPPRNALGAEHSTSALNEPGSQSQGDLTLTLEALQKQVEDYEREMEQYERAQTEWQVEKQSLQDLLNRYQSEVDGTGNQGRSDEPEDERTAVLAQLRQELENLRGAKEGLEKETNRLVQEKEQLQVATKNLEEELNSSISEMQLERGQVDVLKNDLKSYANEKEKMQAAFESVSQELNRSRSEKDELFEALGTLDDQHQDEMAQLLLVRDEFKEKLKAAEEEILQMKDQNGKLREENETLRSEAEEVMSQSKMADDMTVTVNEFREKLKEAVDGRTAAEKTSAELRTELGEVKETLENANSMLETYEHESAQAKQERISSQGKMSALEKEVSDLASQLTEIKAECVRLHADNEELASSQAQSDTEKLYDGLQEKLQRERTASANLKLQFEEVSALLSEREEHLRTRDSNMRQLEERLRETEKMLEEREFSQQTGLAEEQLQKSEQNAEAMLEISDLKEKVEKLTVLTSDTETKLRKASEEKLELEKECGRKDEEIGSLCAELKNAGKDVAQAQSAHEIEVRNLKAEHERVVSAVKQESSERCSELEKGFATFKLESETSAKVYTDKIAHLERANSNLQLSIDHAKEEASQESMDAFENLQKQNSNLENQLQSISNENGVLKHKIETERMSLGDKLKHETEQKIQAQKEVASLKISLQKLQSETDSLQEEMMRISSTLEENSSLVMNDNNIRHTRNECDLRIESLLSETEELKKRLSVRNDIKTADRRVDGLLAQIGRGDIADLEKADLSKEDIGSLLRLIKERGEVISLLAFRPSEDKTASVPAAKDMQDVNRALVAEKDQILAVITEKTRENKKLKDETHKMMQIVSESQAALSKVQQENASLRAKYEGYDREMTKEAVAKLSRLVMEKELEITALKQKCGTLLEVLQQQQPNGETPNSADIALSGKQVQSLLQDKETLTAQVQQLLAERNHLVALLNQSQSETERLRTEIVNAAKAMERDSDTNSKLQISFGNLVHEYEQTQMKLANVQRELEHFRKKLSNLEVEKERLFANTHEVTGRNATESYQKSEDNRFEKSSLDAQSDSLLLSSLRGETEKKDVEIEKLTNDCREKDILIHSRTQELTHFKKNAEVKTNEVEILRKSVGNLREQVAELSKENESRRKEILDSTSRLAEKEAESGAFQETNAQLSMLLKEKEYEIENAREKCRRLETMVEENQQGKESESQKLLIELDQSKQSLMAARHERDQVMLSLKQRKLETDKYSEEASLLREKETKLQSELARLRNHLVQVEEAYTQEAILAEDREKTLREQLERIRSSSSAAKEATEQSQQQAESLQEQLRTAIAQRDQAVQQLQLAQETSTQYATALQKLQTAVERMQREEAATYTEQTNALNSKLEQKTNEAVSLESQLTEIKGKLQDAKEALKSASRLNKQLELKEENIEQLKTLVAEKQLHIDDLQDKIHLIVSKNEGMVDKEIVKNLVIGYFTTPTNKRIDVLHLITSVLGFSRAEVSRVESGSVQGGRKGWMGGWLGWRGGSQNRAPGSGPSSPTGVSPDQSFTQMFVKFLENESVPQQAARLPAAAMANESQQKINQRRFAASPVLSSVPTPVGSSASGRTAPAIAGRFSPFMHVNPVTSTPTKAPGPASTRPALAMHPVTPILPTFTPLTDPNGAKQDTLQDILLSKGDR